MRTVTLGTHISDEDRRAVLDRLIDQLDRFEEDLNISKVRLRSAPSSDSSCSTPTDPPPPTPAQLQNLRQEAKAALARLRTELGKTPNH